MTMVCLAENPRRLKASCWRVEVVKGGGGTLDTAFFSIFFTVHSAFSNSEEIFPAEASVLMANLSKVSPSFLAKAASNSPAGRAGSFGAFARPASLGEAGGFRALSLATMVQYSSGLK